MNPNPDISVSTDSMKRRCIVLVLASENEDMLDQNAERVLNAMREAADNTEFPEGVVVEDVFAEDPDSDEYEDPETDHSLGQQSDDDES